MGSLEPENSSDVIIIGSGPAGLMAAISLASQGVAVTILERNRVRPSRGRADGFEPRTLEILESFGLLDSWYRRANRTVELCVWVGWHDMTKRHVQNCSDGILKGFKP